MQKKSKNFELWKANPLTGRNHQIRIHAQEAQISILGDANYDGANFAFLCLHNYQIEFPNGILITSQPPIYFEDLTLLEDPNLARIYFEMDRRFRLYANRELSQQSFRLIHSNKDQNSLGYSLDHYGDTLVLHWQRENWSLADQTRFSNVAAALKKFLIVRFSEKNQIEISSTPAPSKWTVKENQMSFELRSIAGAATGLSTNQRLQRNWLLNNSKNKSVLNLFSNSGECSVAAALGHAAQVTSVETSKNMLAWSKNNFKLNQLDPGKYIFLGRDSLTFLDQCQKKNQKYDLIVCEAPTFLRREKGHFKIESDFEILLKSLFNCLNPDGEIIFSTYYEKFFIGTLANSIVKTHATVSATMKIQPIEISNILPGLDFELPDEKTNLISFLIRHIKLDQ